MELVQNNPYLIGLGILGALNLVLLGVGFWQFGRYRKVQTELLRGAEVGNMEEMILRYKKTLATHGKNLKELGEILGELIERNKVNVQKIGIVRFNPFSDSGGNMSFALALLDGKNNGIVISSLHSREGTRIYAKPLLEGKSKFSLTEEENEAINEANKKV